MTEKIVQLNEEVIKGQIKEPVRGSVEETLNERNRQISRRMDTHGIIVVERFATFHYY